MAPSLGLSIIVITRNEEIDLPACLESVKTIADEVILVDSGSEDKTLDVARRYTEKVFVHEWTGFSRQKQFALEKASGPWVLNIDADERLTPALAKEIEQTLSQPMDRLPHGFEIPFRHFFLGKRLRFGAGQREKHLRLFRKEHGAYGAEMIHEGVRVMPPVGRLKNVIDHYSYRTISDYLVKCNRYTSMIAEQKTAKGVRFSPLAHLRFPYEFLVRYVVKLGFLDGSAGLIYALLSSMYVWLKYVKLIDSNPQKRTG